MLGSAKFKKMHRNLPAATLIEESLRRGQGILSSSGALSVSTGKYTGRSPKDKFVVEEASTRGEIWSSGTHLRLMRLYSASTAPSDASTTAGTSALALRRSPVSGVNGISTST